MIYAGSEENGKFDDISAPKRTNSREDLLAAEEDGGNEEFFPANSTEEAFQVEKIGVRAVGFGEGSNLTAGECFPGACRGG